MGSVRVRAGPGCSSARAWLRLRRQVEQRRLVCISASVHRHERKGGVAHQSLSSRACHVCVAALIGCRLLISGGEVVVSSVLSAGQALWSLCCRTWSRTQVPLNASLEHVEMKQRCAAPSLSQSGFTQRPSGGTRIYYTLHSYPSRVFVSRLQAAVQPCSHYGAPVSRHDDMHNHTITPFAGLGRLCGSSCKTVVPSSEHAASDQGASRRGPCNQRARQGLSSES
jgi:hypothetical protein